MSAVPSRSLSDCTIDNTPNQSININRSNSFNFSGETLICPLKHSQFTPCKSTGFSKYNLLINHLARDHSYTESITDEVLTNIRECLNWKAALGLMFCSDCGQWWAL